MNCYFCDEPYDQYEFNYYQCDKHSAMIYYHNEEVGFEPFINNQLYSIEIIDNILNIMIYDFGKIILLTKIKLIKKISYKKIISILNNLKAFS